MRSYNAHDWRRTRMHFIFIPHKYRCKFSPKMLIANEIDKKGTAIMNQTNKIKQIVNENVEIDIATEENVIIGEYNADINGCIHHEKE